MFQASYIVFASFFLCGEAALTVTQSQMSVTRQGGRGKTARLLCDVKGLTTTYVHWYQHKEGSALKRILYKTDKSNNPVHDDKSFEEFKVEAGNNDLIKHKVTASDAATYYCAGWESRTTSGAVYYFKVFGRGTKLVITENQPVEPKVTVFPPSSKDGTVTLVCLAEKYFPDVIKLEWKKNDETVSGAMVQDEKDKATIMLKVTDGASFVAGDYSCHVTHESLKDGKFLIPQKTAQPGPVTAPTCPPHTDDKKKETSSLSPFNVGTFAYTLLILKSVTYCGIISVLTSKMKSTQVLGIKKRVP